MSSYGSGKWIFKPILQSENWGLGTDATSRIYTTGNFYCNGNVWTKIKFIPPQLDGETLVSGTGYIYFIDETKYPETNGLVVYDQRNGVSTHWNTDSSGNSYSIIYFVDNISSSTTITTQNFKGWITTTSDLVRDSSEVDSAAIINNTYLNDSMYVIADSMRRKNHETSTELNKLKFPDGYVKKVNSLSTVYSLESGTKIVPPTEETTLGTYIPEGVREEYDGISKDAVIMPVAVDSTYNTANNNGTFTPKLEPYFNSFTVDIPEFDGTAGATPEGLQFNVAFGNSAPSDTGKLWIQSSVPSKISFSSLPSSTSTDSTTTTYNMPALKGEFYLEHIIKNSNDEIANHYIYVFNNNQQILKYDLLLKDTEGYTGSYIGDSTDNWKYTSACGQPILYNDTIRLFGGSSSALSGIQRIINPITESITFTNREARHSNGSYNYEQCRQVIGNVMYAWGGYSGYNPSWGGFLLKYNLDSDTTTYIDSHPQCKWGMIVGSTLYTLRKYSGSLYYIRCYALEGTNAGKDVTPSSLQMDCKQVTTAVNLYSTIYVVSGKNIIPIDTSDNLIKTTTTLAFTTDYSYIADNQIQLVSGDVVYTFVTNTLLNAGEMIIVGGTFENKCDLISSDYLQFTVGVSGAYLGDVLNKPQKVTCYLYSTSSGQWYSL